MCLITCHSAALLLWQYSSVCRELYWSVLSTVTSDESVRSYVL